MKHLLLLRHGKSEANKPGRGDNQRALASRGRTESQQVAAWIDQQGLRPNLALVSTARRTQETWEVVHSVFGGGTPTEALEQLYLASTGEILACLASVDDRHVRAIVVGHNPGLEELCHALSGPGSDPAALANLQRGMPTAGLALFALNGDRWADLAADGARLIAFLRPREHD